MLRSVVLGCERRVVGLMRVCERAAIAGEGREREREESLKSAEREEGEKSQYDKRRHICR
jgi:hypothetical protein